MNIKQWISEYKSLPESSLGTYTNKYQNIEYVNEAFDLIQNNLESNISSIGEFYNLLRHAE